MLMGTVYANDLTIIKVVGHGVVISEDNKISNIKPGDTVSEGNKVVVLGKGTVHMVSKNELVTLKADNEATFKYSKTGPTGKIYLGHTKGQIRFKVVPGNKLDIKTPHMVASVRGTEFTLEVEEEETVLIVDEGEVEATDNQKKSMGVKAGFAIRSAKDGFTLGKTEKKEIVKALIVEKKAKIAEKKASKSNNAGGNSGNNGGGGGNSGNSNNAGGKKK